MAGPVISHNELFDFEKYDAAIAEAKKSTTDLASILNKISESTNNNLAESLSKLKGIKVSVASEKDVQNLQNLNNEIIETGANYTNLKNASSGIAKTQTLVKDSIAAVEAEMKQLVKETKALSEEDRKNEAIGGQKIKRLAELKTVTASYTETVKATTKTLQAADNSYTQLSNELLQLKNQLKNLPNAFDASTGAINEQNAEAVKLSKRIGEVDKAIKTMDATMGTFNRNVGNYESGTVSLRQQLREMTQELAKMELAGERNSDRYNDLVQKAGELKDAMMDVAAEVRRVGSDTSDIEGLVGVFEGVAGAAAVAEGGMALFGAENEEVTKSIQKLQGVQTVLLGIQSIANTLQKESAAVLLIVNIQRRIGVLVTNLQTAAESKSIIVRKLATAAQWALNAAMAANPVGLLIVVVAALATVFLLLVNRTNKAAEAQVKLNEAQKIYFETLERSSGKIEEAGKKRISNLEDELKLAKARGASELVIMSIEQKLAEARALNANKQKGYWGEEISNIDALQKSYDGYLDYIARLKSAQNSGVKTNVITNFQTNETKSKKVKEVDITAATGFAENLKARLDKALKVQEDYENFSTDLKVKALEDQRKALERSWKDKIAGDEAVLAKTKEDSLQELNAKIKLLRDKRDIEIKNVNLTAGEIKKINAQADREISEARLAYQEKIAKSEANTRISIINSQLVLAKEGSEEEYRLKAQLIEETGKLESVGVQFSINNEREKASKLEEINAKILADKIKLEKEKRLAELGNKNDLASGNESLEIVRNKQVLASSKSTIAEIQAARNNVRAIEEQAIQREFDFNQKKYDEGLITFEEFEKQKTQILIDQENLKLSKIQEAAQLEAEIRQNTFQVISEGVNAINELFKFSVDGRISAIEYEKDAAIQAAGDNAKAKENIEKTFNKKIAAEKRKQAQADKAAALFNIALSTAQAVARIWADVPKVDFGASTLLLTGLAIAQGAIQAAVVASKPIPKFRKGTGNAPEGPAIVNDEPGSTYKELIVSGNKAYMPSKRNQLVNLRRGDKVIPAYKTAQILANAERTERLNSIMRNQAMNDSLALNLDNGRKLEIEHSMVNAMMASRISEKAIGDEVGKHIANIPQTIHNYDESGYHKKIRKNNTTITVLNQRNSLS